MKKTVFISRIIIIFLVVMENMLHLIDVDVIHIAGSINYQDYYLIPFIAIFIHFFISNRNKTNYNFGLIVILLIVLVFTSSNQASLNFGQPFSLGLRPQRGYVIIFLSYFPLKKLFSKYPELIFEIFTKIMVIGSIAGILYLFQQLFYSYFIFLNVMSKTRYGSVRLYFDSALVVVGMLIAADRFYRSFNFKYLVPIILGILYELLVSKGRLETAVVIIVLFIGFQFGVKKITLKTLGYFVSIFVFLVFVNSIYFQGLIEPDQSGVEDTMGIRMEGRTLYYLQLFQNVTNFLFGVGYPNLLHQRAVDMSGISVNILLADNGMSGFFYVYGFIGVLLVVLYALKMLKYALYVMKVSGNSFYLMFMLFSIFLSYNITFWWWKESWTFMLVIITASLEVSYKRLIRK
jgi:hypothetical protein